MTVGIQLNMGLALWFALGGPSLQGHIVFLRHPMAGAAVHGTGTIKPTSNCERTVNIDLMVLVYVLFCSLYSTVVLGLQFYPQSEQLVPPRCHRLPRSRFGSLVPDLCSPGS